MGLQWKLRTFDKPFGFLVLKPSGVRFAEVSFRNYLVNWGYMAGIGIGIRFIWVMYIAGWLVGLSVMWRFGIFAVGLQMAIKLNRKKKKNRKRFKTEATFNTSLN